MIQRLSSIREMLQCSSATWYQSVSHMSHLQLTEHQNVSIILEERSIQTRDKTSQTEELQNTLENNEVCLEELQMQRERIRELEVTIQEMKQLEETGKISSLLLQTSSDIIPLSGYNNYILIS